jgi:hypothetical protein
MCTPLAAGAEVVRPLSKKMPARSAAALGNGDLISFLSSTAPGLPRTRVLPRAKQGPDGDWYVACLDNSQAAEPLDGSTVWRGVLKAIKEIHRHEPGEDEAAH